MWGLLATTRYVPVASAQKERAVEVASDALLSAADVWRPERGPWNDFALQAICMAIRSSLGAEPASAP
jgi:hypothetical protein